MHFFYFWRKPQQAESCSGGGDQDHSLMAVVQAAMEVQSAASPLDAVGGRVRGAWRISWSGWPWWKGM